MTTAALPSAVFITGPTASGKTDLALALAQRLPVDLISVDSAMVYRGMNIGTAKPPPSILEQFPHRLVDVCDPNEAYSAARFREDALAAMAQSTASGRIPLLVGGTMLYWRALAGGLSPLPSADQALRETLVARQRQQGAAAMHAWLAEVDPAAATRVHPNDPQRVQRALEVYLLTGRPMSDWWQRARGAGLPYRVLTLVRSPRERAVLHQRIATRLDAMFAAGFEAEVRQLYARGDLHADLPAMRSVGYRQLWAYLSGELGWEPMRDKALVATRQLAKRQYTWLRAQADAHWLWDDLAVEHQGLAVVEAFLEDG